MELTNEELFKQALKDSFTRKIQSRIDSCNEEIVYSPKHIKVMRAILEGRGYHINRASTKKKIAAILIAAALLLLTACSIIYYEEINGFFLKVKEHGIVIWFEKESDQNRFIEEAYEFTYIPEGFYLEKENIDLFGADYIYRNDSNETLRIQQSVLHGVSGFDNEHGEGYFLKIMEIDVFCQRSINYYNYIFKYQNYKIEINSPMELSEDELELIIQGIKVK